MPKLCNNGHQMEEAWDVCPYCPRTGFRTPSLGKTRLESDSVFESKTSPAVAPFARKTVLLSEVPRKSALVGWLVVMEGEQKGDDFRIREGQTVVGSAHDADVILKDQTVSGKHASIRFKDGKFFITDLDSSNGTFLNNREDCLAREELNDNDMIRLGAVGLKFKAL